MINTEIVGIYNGHLQVFRNAQIRDAQIKETATLMNHPIESGTIVTDHKIINPTEIIFNMVISSQDYKNVYYTIQKAFKDSTFLTVQTKAAVYTNMIINNLPHKESPDNFNSLIVLLHLKEVFTVKVLKGSIITPKHAKDTTVKNSGAKDTTKTKTDSAALSLWKKL